MSTGLGYLSYFGMAKETTWNDAVAASDKIPLTDESTNFEFERIESKWLDGHSGQRADSQGPKSVLGPTNVVMVHDEVDTEFVGVGLPLGIAFGTTTWDAGSGANQIILNNNPSTTATLAYEKTVSIHEITGAMCKSLTITGSAGGEITGSFEWIGTDYEFASPTNTSSDLSTLPTVEPLRWLFGDTVFRMATDFSDALAAGDQIAISSFTLNIDFNLTDPEFATPLNAASAPYGATAGLTMKPERNGFRKATLEITIPRYTTNTWLTAYENDSPIQADFVITGSATRKAYIYLPYMKIATAPTNIEGEGMISQVITLNCFRGAAYNGGAGNTVMLRSDASTVIAEEVGIDTDNDRTAAIIS